MSDTVLIATSDLLGPLSQHRDFTAALAFSDADALAAFEAIVQRRPRLVALERLFAATARGAALIDRIRMDPALTACEIRIVAHDAETDTASIAPPALSPPPHSSEAVELDAHGTRAASRHTVPAAFAITVDGRPAQLVDISTSGAQVLVAVAVKPGQRVRMALPSAPRPLRVSGTVQWASFEMPKEGPRYRAGVRFLDADAATMTSFIDQHRTANT